LTLQADHLHSSSQQVGRVRELRGTELVSMRPDISVMSILEPYRVRSPVSAPPSVLLTDCDSLTMAAVKSVYQHSACCVKTARESESSHSPDP
jgi:hypothetical protein